MRYQERYSRLDRLLHRLAFSSFEVRKALADVEDRLCARRLVGIEIDRPVFITALPRAGTTLLLETLGSLGVFATHTLPEHAVSARSPLLERRHVPLPRPHVFRIPVHYDAGALDVDRNLLAAAIELHHELQARSIGHEDGAVRP